MIRFKIHWPKILTALKYIAFTILCLVKLVLIINITYIIIAAAGMTLSKMNLDMYYMMLQIPK